MSFERIAQHVIDLAASAELARERYLSSRECHLIGDPAAALTFVLANEAAAEASEELLRTHFPSALRLLVVREVIYAIDRSTHGPSQCRRVFTGMPAGIGARNAPPMPQAVEDFAAAVARYEAV